MAKASDPVLNPLVADVVASSEKLKAKEVERAEKYAAAIKPLDEEIEAEATALDAAKAKLITEGGGRYFYEALPILTVVPAVPAVVQPDRFMIPEGSIEIVRELTGEHFRKLIDRKEIYTPREGIELGVDLLLTPKKGRELLAILRVPGEPKGARSSFIRGLK